MDELHRYRSFTDSRRYSLYGTMAHVAYGKDARDIGLEQERISVESPSFRVLPVTHKVWTSQQETPLVPFDGTRQPIGPRQRSNEDKHRICRYALSLAGIGTKHRNLFQVRFAMCLSHAGM